jgi:biopolymer transport protein TolR
VAMGGGGGRDKLQSDINVTPLVDVCLVLLIIFMVVTPLLNKGVPIQLPETANPDKKPESGKQKLITIAPGSPARIYLEADSVTKEEFQRRLDELYQRVPDTELNIKADKHLKYGDVKEVMKMTKEAGFQNVGLIADKKVSTASK